MMLVFAPQEQEGCPADCKGCTKEEPHKADCPWMDNGCGGCVNECREDKS